MTDKQDPVGKPALLHREEPTTPDLVELTQRGFEAANRRDLRAVLRLFGPDGVWDMSPMGMGTSEGASAIREFMEVWWGAYDEYRIEPEEIVDLGNGIIFAAVNQGGRPVGSSGSVALRYGSVTSWSNRLIERVTNYSDLDEARAAAERLAQERG
jgi:ketosteroid isomerase-like protein